MIDFSVFLKLAGNALIPVAVSLIFYVLKRRTRFANLPYAAQQIIIGIVFGLVAIAGTEFGVNVGGATANTRDAAPLCAGLLFGAPAGIISGVIGGIERWFAAPWAGYYSQLACTVSTVLCGLYAAYLRKFVFENKRASWGLGLATGVIMEVIHLIILFLTHLDDVNKVYEIIKICALPMIIANGVSVSLACLALSLASNDLLRRTGEKRERSVSQKVQSRLLIVVTIAYLVTTLFVYVLQTGSAVISADKIISINLEDVSRDITDTTDRRLLETTSKIADAVNGGTADSLDVMQSKYGVAEINLVGEDGIIYESSNPEYVGFDMRTGEQSEEFLCLLDDEKEFVQAFTNVSFDTSDDERSRKYAGIVLERGGFVQVGSNYEQFREEIESTVLGLTDNRHVGETGCVLVIDNDGTIVGGRDRFSSSDASGIGLDFAKVKAGTRNRSVVDGADSYWSFAEAEGYRIVAFIPSAEVYSTRDASVYVNSFMEVIVFAALFLLVYYLMKRQVVSKLHSVNDSLTKIIGGDLDETVDVRSSSEFSSLSDDINSTVTTLKHYISEAESRIDKELEFAKNIQHSALPSVFPAYPNIKQFDVYATMDTAKEVGGDFYDFYMLGDDKLAFLIADVSGKGIPAAMFMMRAKTMLKNYAETGLPVNEVLTMANDKLCEGNDAGMFVTAWMGILDVKSGRFEYSCAGHNPPLIYRAGKGYEYLRVRPAGFVLAGMEGMRYKLFTDTLAPGDKLYLYTDGVTEATDPDEKLYGEDRLLDYLNSHADASPEKTLLGVREDIDVFVREAEQFDDITMLGLLYNGEGNNNMTTKTFPAEKAALDDVNAFVEGMLEEAGASVKTTMQVLVAVEEIFVNIASYAYPDGEGSADVSVSCEGGVATVSFSDGGVPFDPLAKDDPDVTESADERRIGGLGIFMVKKSMDSVYYDYRDGKNVFTFTKKL